MPATEQTQPLASSQERAFHVEGSQLPPKVPAPKLTDTKDVDLDRPSLKRKEVESSGSNRFKVVSQLVIAMRRFQASLNPTYIYGKRTPTNSGVSPGGSFNNRIGTAATPEPQEVSSGESFRQLTPGMSARQFSRRGDQGPPKAPRNNHDCHGNKTSFLFKPLPPLPGEPGYDGPPVLRSPSGRSIDAPSP